MPDILPSPRSAKLAGGRVTLSPAVPTRFDAALNKHHIAIGRWVLEHRTQSSALTHDAARSLIEITFVDEVKRILAPIELADLHVMVLLNSYDDKAPPALIISNKSQGQIDLGWIETDEDAPIAWHRRAYQALVRAIQPIIPAITYDDMFEHLSHLYWDGETDDEAARESLRTYQDYDESDLAGMTMPSQLDAKRPEWMLDRSDHIPDQIHSELEAILADITAASEGLEKARKRADAFQFTDMEDLCAYAPWYKESLGLPSMTVVPFEIFASEIDDVARHGMESGFLDVSGIYHLDRDDPADIDNWFTTLRAGVAVIEAVQRLTAWTPPPSP